MGSELNILHRFANLHSACYPCGSLLKQFSLKNCKIFVFLRHFELQEAFRNELLRQYWIVVLLVHNHLPARRSAIFDLFKLDLQQIVHLPKILSHVILFYSQEDINCLLIKFRINFLVKHFNFRIQIDQFLVLSMNHGPGCLLLRMVSFNCIIKLASKLRDGLLLLQQAGVHP